LPPRVLAPNLSVINGHVFCSIIATAVIVNEEGSEPCCCAAYEENEEQKVTCYYNP